jgi:ribosome maturation factor RimP
MNDKERIIELLQPYLDNDRIYVVDIQVAGRQGGRLKVTILLDSDAGITIDECAAISRQLGGQMDEMNFFGEAPFTLEVSSPGVDFPLTFPRQYIRNIGRQLAVTLTDGRVWKGTLDAVEENQIILDVVPEKKSKSQLKKEVLLHTEAPVAGPTTVSFGQIQKANVEISFK